MEISPYLSFSGQCGEAFKFYERCLGGKVEAIFPFAGTPAEAHVPPDWKDKIMHARLVVDGQAIMGSDGPGEKAEPARGFHVSLNVNDVARAERIFNELAEGGKVEMPFAETFWAHRFGMLVDRFGTPWMINCENKSN